MASNPSQSSSSSPSSTSAQRELSPMEDPRSPFFLHHGESPGAILVSQSLTEDNYSAWARAMRMALDAKRKLGFVDGSITASMAVTPLEKLAWSKNNSMISSWILNSVSPHITASVIYRDTALEVWNALRNRFSQANGPRISQLQKQISTAMQGDSTVTSFFTGLQTAWDQLLNFRPLPCCACGKCTCGVNDKITSFQHQESLMQFLNGLNDVYSQVRTQILMMEPIPSLDKAHSLVIQEERQRALGFNVNPSVGSTALAVKNQGFNQSSNFSGNAGKNIKGNGGKGRPICSHCGKAGHVMEKCYKLVGFPPRYKQKGKVSMANQVIVGGDQAQSDFNPQTASFPFTSEQCQQLLSMLSAHASASTSNDAIHSANSALSDIAEAVIKDGGIRLLLDFAKSSRGGLQSEAAKAITNLSEYATVAKVVAEEGGINILVGLARSMNTLVAEEAAGGLCNLSCGKQHKGAIVEAGGVKTLVDLIFKWSTGGEVILERAAAALANMAADAKCGTEVAVAGGVHALVMLVRNCKFYGVQEQAARALSNLAGHGDSNNNNAAIGQQAGALEALVQLTHSPNERVRQEAAGALWNLSDRNREAIAAAGGIEALVTLAQSCSNASTGLQENAAGALMGLSVSEASSVAIGREGGVAPLIALARSESEAVHGTAAGALWNLAFNPGNALRIVEEGGVPALVHLCSSSQSKLARFSAAIALTYIVDGRMDEYALVGTSSESISKSVSLDGARRMALKHIEAFVLTFSDPHAFAAAAASSAPAALSQVTEGARIQEAGHLRCSGMERFVAMLQNPSSILKACAAFALLQFTIPGGQYAMHHASLMQKAGAARVLHAVAAAATAPLEAKIFARIVLRNLEHHHIEPSL